jgi:plasmid stabilization system protein ParE
VPLGRYAIYYRTRGDSVEVLRVLRAAQDSGLAQSG